MKVPDEKQLAAIAAAFGLVGSVISVLAKGWDSISLNSRRSRELKRIEDLTSLLQKTRAEAALTKSTMDNLTAQIEAEISVALHSLERNRHRVLQKRKEYDESDLGLLRRTFLFYRPTGIRAWVPHVLAYALALFCFFGIFGSGLGEDNTFHWSTLFANRLALLGLAIFLIPLVPLRMWALWERKQWRKKHPNPLSLAPKTVVDDPSMVKQAGAGKAAG